MSSINLTPEQKFVRDYDGNIIVHALAGSGKTTTLYGFAKSRPEAQILYLVYNRSMKEEARRKMPRNVNSQTIHSLAYRYEGYKYKNLQNLTKDNILKYLKLPYNLDNIILSDIIIKYLACYWNSSAEMLSSDELVETFEKLLGIKIKHFWEIHMDQVISLASYIWGAMLTKSLPMTHDGYLKLFHLSHTRLSFDYVLVDEAQDSTGVLKAILNNTKAKKVIVGDPHQQVYSWRWAISIMDVFKYEKATISQSFRFGQPVADLAVEIIRKLKGVNDFSMIGAGSDGVEIDTISVDEKRTVISRKNMPLFEHAIGTAGPVYFEGGPESYVFFRKTYIQGLVDLFLGRKSIKGPFARFQTFSEVELYADTMQDQESTSLINLVKKFKRNLLNLMDELQGRTVTAIADSHIAYSTAHRAKGREYDNVEMIGDSFTSYPDFIEASRNERKKKKENVWYSNEYLHTAMMEEVNLLYVAVTRVRKKLIIPSWLMNLHTLEPVNIPLYKNSTKAEKRFPVFL